MKIIYTIIFLSLLTPSKGVLLEKTLKIKLNVINLTLGEASDKDLNFDLEAPPKNTFEKSVNKINDLMGSIFQKKKPKENKIIVRQINKFNIQPLDQEVTDSEPSEYTLSNVTNLMTTTEDSNYKLLLNCIFKILIPDNDLITLITFYLKCTTNQIFKIVEMRRNDRTYENGDRYISANDGDVIDGIFFGENIDVWNNDNLELIMPDVIFYLYDNKRIQFKINFEVVKAEIEDRKVVQYGVNQKIGSEVERKLRKDEKDVESGKEVKKLFSIMKRQGNVI
jgi:hypothetical protein